MRSWAGGDDSPADPGPSHIMRTAVHWYLLSSALFSAVGDAEIEAYRNFSAIGSSVLFPGLKSGVEFKNNMIYELRKVGTSPGWLVMEHGEPKVQKFYEKRGKYFPENKSFLLTDLTEEDNGVYEQKLNQKTLLQVILTVIDPVKEPFLRREDDSETCRITLLCAGWERNSSNVTFLRDNVVITGSTIRDENLLDINGTDPQHWGIYMCALENRVSQKVSQQLKLIPEEIPGESLFFYVCCMGCAVYIYHLLCLLYTCWCSVSQQRGSRSTEVAEEHRAPTWTSAQNETESDKKKKCSHLLQKVLSYSKCIAGASMEFITFSIIMHEVVNNPPSDAARWITVFIIFITLLCRCLWALMFCGFCLHTVVLFVVEDALFAADLLLLPAIFIEYMRLYVQASDLCGMKREQRWSRLFYLVIGFVVFLLGLLSLRIILVKCRTSDPPDPHKGCVIPAPAQDEKTNIHVDGRKNEQAGKESQTEEDTLL